MSIDRMLLGSLVVILLLVPAAMAETPLSEVSDGRELRVGLWRPFFEGLNSSDAIEATQVWIESWGRKGGLCTSAKAMFFSDLEQVANALLRRELDFAVMETRQYLAIEDQGLVEPTFTTLRGGTKGDEYVLLVREDNGIQSLEDLAGKEINLPNSGYYDIAKTWLDLTLAEHGLPPARQFFGAVTVHGKPSQIVLPVFFGKTDACLVTRSDFELMGELNPQVGAQIRELRRSPCFVSMVFCTSPHLDADFMTQITDSILNLELDPHTQQILTLHRMDCIVRLSSEDLDTVRDLSENDR